VCVDFRAGWLWFIRSPLKNRCGKGNEMHKKRGVCVLSVSDHGFFFFFYYSLSTVVCVGEKKMRLRTGCVIIIIRCVRKGGFLVHRHRIYAEGLRAHVYIIILLHYMRAASCCNMVFTARYANLFDDRRHNIY